MSDPVNRRAFLSQLGASGALLAAGPWLRSIGYAQIARGPARAVMLQSRTRAAFDRRLFGAFLEHLGRAIYTGVYEPGSPPRRRERIPHRRHRGDQGARRADHAVPGRQLRLRLQLARRRRAEEAAARPCWSAPGTRSRRTSSAPTSSSTGASASAPSRCSAMNLGTGTPEMAVAYVEYCNVDKGTKWSELRRSHGYDAPHNVRVLVPRQRDGRPVADGPHAGPRLRPQGARHGAPDPRHRSQPAADRLRLEQHDHADVPGLGPRGARGVLRPGGRHLAAQLLRQHAGADGQQHARDSWR